MSINFISFFLRQVETLDANSAGSALYIGVVDYFLALATQLLAQIIIHCKP